MNAHDGHPAGPFSAADDVATIWQDAASCDGVFRHTGTCQVPIAGVARAVAVGFSVNRRTSTAICDVPPAQESDVESSGTPGWLTNVGRIRSTGWPDAAATAVQKSCEVALPY